MLYICKLACSLPLLPSLSTTTFSPVSFCCCCLLVFTDVLVTVFLGFLWILKCWQTEWTSAGDVIALRTLLFISHTYGAVFLLTLPVIAVDTLICLRTERCQVKKLIEDKARDKSEGKPLSYVVRYLCCLSLWSYGTLNIRWRWKLEEVWTAACLHSTNSIMTCLPNMFSPMLRLSCPCWALTLLYFILVIILIISTVLLRRQATTHSLTDPLTMSVSERAQSVDPEKTESSCSTHTRPAWNSVQMLAYLYGDSGLLSPGCSVVEEGGQGHGKTEKVIALTFIPGRLEEPHRRSPCWWRRWGFSCLGANVMIGVVCVLAIFVFPLSFSINIYLISSIEKVLELSVKSLALSKSAISYNDMHMI